jgi:8-oxo-dGTP pyrophosphatase MutT (NUDIX family)
VVAADAWLWRRIDRVTAIRDAATVILLRDRTTRPRVLMGQRGAGAAFMPNKFVFPGGAIDPGDATTTLSRPVPAPCATRLATDSVLPPATIAAAAIRELWEEAGLALARPGPAPDGWPGFPGMPDAGALRFVFRAVTPAGRPRRFDARFLLAPTEAILGDPDDFSRATDELSHLQWVPLDAARSFDLPFITEIVLAEVAWRLTEEGPPPAVPFFRNNDDAHQVAHLGLDVTADRD